MGTERSADASALRVSSSINAGKRAEWCDAKIGNHWPKDGKQGMIDDSMDNTAENDI